MPFVAAGILDELLRHKELFFILLVIIIGVLQAVTRAANAAMKKIGPSAHGPDRADMRGGRTPHGLEPQPADSRRRPRAATPTDPEEMLPEFLRPQSWERAKAAGVVVESPPAAPPAAPAPPIRRRRDAPVPAARPAKPRRGSRKKRVRPTSPDDEPTHRLLKSSRAATVAHIEHEHGLLGLGQPTRGTVRRAILWAEILGPPRALRPYEPPRRRLGGGPPAVAVLPLRPKT